MNTKSFCKTKNDTITFSVNYFFYKKLLQKRYNNFSIYSSTKKFNIHFSLTYILRTHVKKSKIKILYWIYFLNFKKLNVHFFLSSSLVVRIYIFQGE